MNKTILTSIYLSCMSVLSGCAMFTSPLGQTVEQQYVGPLWGDNQTSVFALAPDRRTIVVNANTSKNDKSDGRPKLCSEPPTDVANNIANSFKALAAVELKSTETNKGQGNLDLSHAFNSTVVSLFYRSQGAGMFRDGLFSLCQAYMNGVFKDREEKFFEAYDKLLISSAEIIKLEIPAIKDIREQNLAIEMSKLKSQTDANVQTARQAADDAKKLAEEAKKSADEAKFAAENSKKTKVDGDN